MNPYSELGVSPSATAEEIEAAARRHAKDNHPDAGGDRDAFDRGRRALVVLRDPKKRATYDAIGELDEKPENHTFAQAMNLLSQKLGQIIGQPLDPDRFDVVGAIRQSLASDQQGINSAKVEQQRHIAKLEKYAKRLKMKAGVDKENLLVASVHAQIGAHRQMIAQADEKLAVAKFAAEILADYIYEVEPAPTRPMNARPMGGWDVSRSIFGDLI